MKPTVTALAGSGADCGCVADCGALAAFGAWVDFGAGACAGAVQVEAIARTESVSERSGRILCTLVVGESARKNPPGDAYNRAAGAPQGALSQGRPDECSGKPRATRPSRSCS